ncbi:stage II sporulation protein D [Bacillaceae bacterium W0354]
MKKQAFILVGILLFVITVLPTLIVIPFSEATTDVEWDENEPITTIEDTEQPSVAVMRSNSGDIENVPLEQYVISVVASEMPADFEIEAIKAQAVAARTYIVQKLMQPESEEYDVTDTVTHQVYKNFDELRQIWGVDYSWKMNKITQAVNETKGKILTYNGKPITAAFFSTSNGYTENAEDYWQNEIPYLKSVSSPWDEQSPKYIEQEIFELNEVVQKLGLKQANTLKVSNVVKTDSNRIKEIQINGKKFTGRQVRELLGLRSNDFTIELKGNHAIFTTKGFGHGVGMSQYGANGMAKEGKTFDEIVKHYYQGIDITSVDQVLDGTLSVMK